MRRRQWGRENERGNDVIAFELNLRLCGVMVSRFMGPGGRGPSAATAALVSTDSPNWLKYSMESTIDIHLNPI